MAKYKLELKDGEVTRTTLRLTHTEEGQVIVSQHDQMDKEVQCMAFEKHDRAMIMLYRWALDEALQYSNIRKVVSNE